MDFGFLFTSTVGRINRAKWWIGVIILMVVNIVLSWVLLAALGASAAWALLILQLVLIYPSYAVSGKRFQDRGRPGTLGLIGPGLSFLYQLLITFGVLNPLEPGGLYYLYLIVMFAVGIWYLVDLGILKGSTGTNEYGADPLGAMA
jgi:uncharacterized membrane protein YhaH (DUF805 family)